MRNSTRARQRCDPAHAGALLEHLCRHRARRLDIDHQVEPGGDLRRSAFDRCADRGGEGGEEAEAEHHEREHRDDQSGAPEMRERRGQAQTRGQGESPEMVGDAAQRRRECEQRDDGGADRQDPEGQEDRDA
ncbi:MAG: hypothetical protein V9E99_02295 [Microthrixaceae bacterium]